ncbi:unnamed protein product [Phytophthora lilii]|uniref:Unnamed protein product n=1 Tax=Phytophthora lilii TaxID=2077276 RepID=A0A9W6U4Q2_9STRA|nr:unnamed protein product [Phytophthora lilii]
MPLDAFSRMGALTFMHLGYLQLLPELPSFEGLHNLKSMSLALLFAVTSLPEIKHIVKLQRLDLVSLFALQTVPEVALNQHLQRIVIVNTPVCCNGFIGDCNLLHPVCSSISGITCLTKADQCSESSRAIFASQSTTCDKSTPYFPAPKQISQSQVDICGGVMYRKCHVAQYQNPGKEVVGICINNYFQVIACSPGDIFAINGRRQEIIRGIGLPCDPIEEAWLGCV